MYIAECIGAIVTVKAGDPPVDAPASYEDIQVTIVVVVAPHGSTVVHPLEGRMDVGERIIAIIAINPADAVYTRPTG